MQRRYFEGFEDTQEGARGHTNLGVTTGEFTPVLAFGGQSIGITYSTQKGYYTQIDGIMHIDLDIVLTNKGSSTGAATISGLPVASKHGPMHQMFSLGAEYLSFPASEVPKPRLASNSSSISLVCTKSNAATTILTDSDFSNNTTIEITGTYMTTEL